MDRRTMNFLKGGLAGVLLVYMMGCTTPGSISSRTTAKSIGHLNLEGHTGVGISGIQFESTDNSDITISGGDITVDLGARIGILDFMDVGLNVMFTSVYAEILADFKLTFLDLGIFAMGVDPGLGYLGYYSLPGGALKWSLPLLMDVTPVDWFTITFGPKYIGTNWSNSFFIPDTDGGGTQDITSSVTLHYLGGSAFFLFRISELFGFGPYGGAVVQVGDATVTVEGESGEVETDIADYLYYDAGLAFKLWFDLDG